MIIETAPRTGARLSPEELAYFETFGFIVRKQLLTSAEVAGIGEQIDGLLAAARDGKPFDGKERQAIHGYIEKGRGPTWLLEDDRIVGPIEQVLGAGFCWMSADANLYVGETAWHFDGNAVPGFESIKVAFYLDSVGRDTGCLRAIPGSHRRPFHDEMRLMFLQRTDPSVSPFGVEPADLPAYAAESEPGDVVFFHHSIWHASFGGAAGRRMFTFNFHSAPMTNEHYVTIGRHYHQALLAIEPKMYFKQRRLFDPAFVERAGPRTRGMFATWLGLGLT